MPETSTSNKSSKIDLHVVHAQKSATFDPPNPRPQNPAWEALQLWAGKKLCFPNSFKIVEKEISDQAHPLRRENDPSRSSALSGSEAPNRVCFIT